MQHFIGLRVKSPVKSGAKAFSKHNLPSADSEPVNRTRDIHVARDHVDGARAVLPLDLREANSSGVAVSPAGLAAAGVVARGSAAARIRASSPRAPSAPTAHVTSLLPRRSLRARRRGWPPGHVPEPVRAPAVADVDGDGAASVQEKRTKKKLRLRIDGEWYDCTGWAKAHPGGSLFITLMDGCDATDVFYALHSYGPNGDDTAARRLAMLPKCGGPEEDLEEGEEAVFSGVGRSASPPGAPHTFDVSPGQADAAFADVRKKFEVEGWFARDPLKEAAVLCTTLGLYGLGWFLAGTHPILATLSLGLGMQQAGWLAHDYIHGRGPWCAAMRGFGALTNGFSAEWWQHTHNMHHSFTNIDGRDGDIKLEPLYFLQDPEVTKRPDNPAMRKWQHWYGYPLYAFTYALWRRHSVAARGRARTRPARSAAIHYTWLFTRCPVRGPGFDPGGRWARWSRRRTRRRRSCSSRAGSS